MSKDPTFSKIFLRSMKTERIVPLPWDSERKNETKGTSSDDIVEVACYQLRSRTVIKLEDEVRAPRRVSQNPSPMVEHCENSEENDELSVICEVPKRRVLGVIDVDSQDSTNSQVSKDAYSEKVGAGFGGSLVSHFPPIEDIRSNLGEFQVPANSSPRLDSGNEMTCLSVKKEKFFPFELNSSQLKLFNNFSYQAEDRSVPDTPDLVDIILDGGSMYTPEIKEEKEKYEKPSLVKSGTYSPEQSIQEVSSAPLHDSEFELLTEMMNEHSAVEDLKPTDMFAIVEAPLREVIGIESGFEINIPTLDGTPKTILETVTKINDTINSIGDALETVGCEGSGDNEEPSWRTHLQVPPLNYIEEYREPISDINASCSFAVKSEEPYKMDSITSSDLKACESFNSESFVEEKAMLKPLGSKTDREVDDVIVTDGSRDIPCDLAQNNATSCNGLRTLPSSLGEHCTLVSHNSGEGVIFPDGNRNLSVEINSNKPFELKSGGNAVTLTEFRDLPFSPDAGHRQISCNAGKIHMPSKDICNNALILTSEPIKSANDATLPSEKETLAFPSDIEHCYVKNSRKGDAKHMPSINILEDKVALIAVNEPAGNAVACAELENLAFPFNTEDCLQKTYGSIDRDYISSKDVDGNEPIGVQNLIPPEHTLSNTGNNNYTEFVSLTYPSDATHYVHEVPSPSKKDTCNAILNDGMNSNVAVSGYDITEEITDSQYNRHSLEQPSIFLEGLQNALDYGHNSNPENIVKETVSSFAESTVAFTRTEAPAKVFEYPMFPDPGQNTDIPVMESESLKNTQIATNAFHQLEPSRGLPAFGSAFSNVVRCLYEIDDIVMETDQSNNIRSEEFISENQGTDRQSSENLSVLEIGGYVSPIPEEIEKSFYWSPTKRHLDMAPFLKYLDFETIGSSDDPELEFLKQIGRCDPIDKVISAEYRKRQREGKVPPDPEWLMTVLKRNKKLVSDWNAREKKLSKQRKSFEPAPRGTKRRRTNIKKNAQTKKMRTLPTSCSTAKASPLKNAGARASCSTFVPKYISSEIKNSNENNGQNENHTVISNKSTSENISFSSNIKEADESSKGPSVSIAPYFPAILADKITSECSAPMTSSIIQKLPEIYPKHTEAGSVDVFQTPEIKTFIAAQHQQINTSHWMSVLKHISNLPICRSLFDENLGILLRIFKSEFQTSVSWKLDKKLKRYVQRLRTYFELENVVKLPEPILRNPRLMKNLLRKADVNDVSKFNEYLKRNEAVFESNTWSKDWPSNEDVLNSFLIRVNRAIELKSVEAQLPLQYVSSEIQAWVMQMISNVTDIRDIIMKLLGDPTETLQELAVNCQRPTSLTLDGITEPTVSANFRSKGNEEGRLGNNPFVLGLDGTSIEKENSFDENCLLSNELASSPPMELFEEPEITRPEGSKNKLDSGTLMQIDLQNSPNLEKRVVKDEAAERNLEERLEKLRLEAMWLDLHSLLRHCLQEGECMPPPAMAILTLMNTVPINDQDVLLRNPDVLGTIMALKEHENFSVCSAAAILFSRLKKVLQIQEATDEDCVKSLVLKAISYHLTKP